MMATVLGVTLSHSMEESRKQQAVNEKIMLSLLADLSRIALLTAEYVELQPYIEQVVNDPNVITVLVADNNHKVVLSNQYSYLGRPLPKFIHGETRHWRSQEIRNRAGFLGTIAMQFSEEELIKANRDVMNLAITVALFGMVSIAVIGILIGFLLTRRLEILSESAEQLASGKLDARTNFSGKDEVSIVGRAFDQMASNVSYNMSALQKATDLLEQRVTERTEELAVARDDAINANASKSAFLATMSHEIRTPLTAIIGYSESMLENRLSRQEQSEHLQTIIRSGKHLSSIINDILDLSKIEADKMEIEVLPLNPFELLQDVHSLIDMQAQAKGLAFDIEYNLPLPAKLYSDPIRLKQILINLASNAVKFTHEGYVNIVVKHDPLTKKIHFRVIDSGIGLTDAQKDKLFKPFSQADSSTTREYGGTGLGLHLSRQLAEKLGGTISLESSPGAGSCFDLCIATGDLTGVPLLDKVPQPRQTAAPTNRAICHRLTGRILLAEDNTDNQRLISTLIRQIGAEVDIANNGSEAIRMAQASTYDLVLMDMQMPVISGVDAITELRRQQYTGPIVALTANAMQEDVRRCMAAGCNEHFAKPIDRQKFRELLDKYLQPILLDEQPGLSPIYSTILDEEPDLVDILSMFIARLPGSLTNICEAFETKDFDRLRELTHDLKGTSGNFGYEGLYELAMQIEEAVKHQWYDRIPGLLLELEDICRRILLGFKKHPVAASAGGK